jgi:hypothetical protein
MARKERPDQKIRACLLGSAQIAADVRADSLSAGGPCSNVVMAWANVGLMKTDHESDIQQEGV